LFFKKLIDFYYILVCNFKKIKLKLSLLHIFINTMPTPKTLSLKTLQKLLPPRARDAHKGLFGHVLIIGGDYGMAGAVRLAGEAALRAGAGLVSVTTRPEHIGVVSSARPELMCHGVTRADGLEKILTRATVLVIGPGLGQSDWSKNLLAAALSSPQPKVIDADGLNLLARQPHKNDNWILTPHVGEAGRLLNCTTASIGKDRIHAVKTLQNKFGGVCILKGAGSLIADKNSLSICKAGNPGMASGGMGDVLSGIIGGLLAQGLSLQQATELGVCLHAHAGDLAAKKNGERGLLASDLILYLRKLVN
jgi:ADP-dependent NAD(P)H-hydrate dehydratase / NAD(P)H-hydrate epimerase